MFLIYEKNIKIIKQKYFYKYYYKILLINNFEQEYLNYILNKTESRRILTKIYSNKLFEDSKIKEKSIEKLKEKHYLNESVKYPFTPKINQVFSYAVTPCYLLLNPKDKNNKKSSNKDNNISQYLDKFYSDIYYREQNDLENNRKILSKTFNNKKNNNIIKSITNIIPLSIANEDEIKNDKTIYDFFPKNSSLINKKRKNLFANNNILNKNLLKNKTMNGFYPKNLKNQRSLSAQNIMENDYLNKIYNDEYLIKDYTYMNKMKNIIKNNCDNSKTKKNSINSNESIKFKTNNNNSSIISNISPTKKYIHRESNNVIIPTHNINLDFNGNNKNDLIFHKFFNSVNSFNISEEANSSIHNNHKNQRKNNNQLNSKNQSSISMNNKSNNNISNCSNINSNNIKNLDNLENFNKNKNNNNTSRSNNQSSTNYSNNLLNKTSTQSYLNLNDHNYKSFILNNMKSTKEIDECFNDSYDINNNTKRRINDNNYYNALNKITLQSINDSKMYEMAGYYLSEEGSNNPVENFKKSSVIYNKKNLHNQ